MMPVVFIISAPSGSGKTTLVRRLMCEVGRLHFSISYTTRSPRGQEQDGREYFFVRREQFEEMIEQSKLLEWANVFGNYYGTARDYLKEAGTTKQDLLLDIDVQGAEQVKSRVPNTVSIFILPPSRPELEVRLRHRGQDTEAVIRKRLSDAQREIVGYHRYDYGVINDQLEQSAAFLRSIVLHERWRQGSDLAEGDPSLLREIAEGCRTERLHSQVQPILESFQHEMSGGE
jgi:guanylate kinase